MGITSVSWIHDKRGVPLGAGEMSIRPLDLANVGEAILDGGVWQGKAVIPPGWMTQSTAPSTTFAPNYGLLWWRLGDNSASESPPICWRSGVQWGQPIRPSRSCSRCQEIHNAVRPTWTPPRRHD